jgi:hypothetical protein
VINPSKKSLSTEIKNLSKVGPEELNYCIVDSTNGKILALVINRYKTDKIYKTFVVKDDKIIYDTNGGIPIQDVDVENYAKIAPPPKKSKKKSRNGLVSVKEELNALINKQISTVKVKGATSLGKALQTYIEENSLEHGDFLFPASRGNNLAMDSSEYSKLIISTFKKVLGKNVGVNALRHSYLSYVHQHVVNELAIDIIAKCAGTSNEESRLYNKTDLRENADIDDGSDEE